MVPLLLCVVFVKTTASWSAPVPTQRLLNTRQNHERTEAEKVGSGSASVADTGGGASTSTQTHTALDPAALDLGEENLERQPEVQQLKQEEAKDEELTIGQLPPRPDAHCSKDADASLPEAEQQAAVFACRKAKARKQAEAACEGLAEDAAPKPFARAALDLAALTREESGSPILGMRPDASPVEPKSLPIAVEPEADIVSQAILEQGYWEYHEVRTIITALQLADKEATGARPPLLLDIGANLGMYAVVAAALGYEVIAFEAMERNVAAIHQTLCWNPELRERITLFPYALGEEELACVVVSDPANVADGHVTCNEQEIAAMAGLDPHATVHSVRLGDYLAGVKADVMKIDVEGYEPHVLAGAGSALDSVQSALSEVNADGSLEYLRGWVDRGFDITVCPPSMSCFAGEPASAEEAAETTIKERIINVLLQRNPS